jgi:hypothetical protein
MNNDLKTRLAAARAWAADQECVITLDGQVGFGRPCVGVMWQDHYVDTPGSDFNEIREDERIAPPEDVRNYHKHDCLAVLGTDDQALDGLLRWVENLIGHGATVTLVDRDPSERDNFFSAMLHGPKRPMIVFPEANE